MPSINMIAPRRAERRRLERDARRLLFFICLEIVVAVAVSGVLWARIYSTRARIGDLEVQLIKLQPEVKRIQMLQAMTSELQPKLTLLTEAKSRTLHWYNFLDKLSRSLPEKTWIRRIDSCDPTADKPDEYKIVLSGVAGSHALVGELMMRLYGNQDLDSVGLRFTQATDVGRRPVYEFEVAADLKTAKAEQKGVTENGTGKS